MKYFFDGKILRAPASSQQAIKEHNLRRAFHCVYAEKRVSRAQIAKTLQLTPTTVSSLIDELIGLELVRETGDGFAASPGRKPIMLEINRDAMQIPVISFRRTGLRYVLYDFSCGEVESAFLPFPPELRPKPYNGQGRVEYRFTDGSWLSSLAIRMFDEQTKLLDRQRVGAVGLVMPGTFQWGDGKFTSAVLQIRGGIDAVIQAVRSQFHNVPLLAGNDSAFLACAEYAAANEPGELVFVNISHGVGAGIIQNGQLFGGMSDSPCEIGHMSVDIDGLQCVCGNCGCLERYINQDDLVREACGNARIAPEWEVLCDAYRRGNPVVVAAVDQRIRYLLLGISNLVCALGARHIVLGGGIEGLGDEFLRKVRERAPEIGNARRMAGLRFRYTTLAANGECLGAARRFIDHCLPIVSRSRGRDFAREDAVYAFGQSG